MAPADAAPRRVHIVGGPGSGKTTLAVQIGALFGLPVHHLDDVFRVGGGTGSVRPEAERRERVGDIAAEPAWVTEGIHLGWTDPFFDTADLVIWLDTVGWVKASSRLVHRFGANANANTGDGTAVKPSVAGASVGHRSVGRRVRDGVGHGRDLIGAIAETRHYHLHPRGTENLPETRVSTRDRLDGHAGRLVRCRTDADVAALLFSLGGNV